MGDDIRKLIFQAIDQAISGSDFDRLQDAIQHNDDVRVEYLRAVNLCESLRDITVETHSVAPQQPVLSASETLGNDNRGASRTGIRFDSKTTHLWNWRLMSIAATLLALVGGIAFWLGQKNESDRASQISNDTNQLDNTIEESVIAGHATLRRSVDIRWSDQATAWREGDVLPDGLFQFDDGIAEIDFFCGATLIVEGPATLDIESDWSVRVAEGRLRANGFVVKAADSEIVDLGTEFALEVGSENARVEVIDGEVELRGGQHNGDHLFTGETQLLMGTQTRPDIFEGLSTVNDIQRRRDDAGAQRFAEWKQHSQKLSSTFAVFDDRRNLLKRESEPRMLEGTFTHPLRRRMIPMDVANSFVPVIQVLASVMTTPTADTFQTLVDGSSSYHSGDGACQWCGPPPFGLSSLLF